MLNTTRDALKKVITTRNALHPLLTTTDVATWLGGQRRKVYDLCHAGVLPCYNVSFRKGGKPRYRFVASELNAWLEKQGNTHP